MINDKINAVYARQSVDKKDSISIESQIEFCHYELKGGEYREYKDKGYSGKDTDRPDFKRLVRDIEQGLVKRVVVYKLDRISRSILDFAGMMEMFQRYGVEFVSSTEKFDTSTPMGRAMLNICIVFAQLERESIQQRILDAFQSRKPKGFCIGGKAPYGYTLEPWDINGIPSKRYAIHPEQAGVVKVMFDMYSQPNTSYGDIVRWLCENNIQIFGKQKLNRCSLSRMMRNPSYVMADFDVYEFYKSQGTEIANDVVDFNGINGCYLYRGRNAETGKHQSLDEQLLVVAPHEGLIPSDVWLKCRRKLLNNNQFQGARKAKNTWLAGKIKCGNCGYALMSLNHGKPGKTYQSLRCSKRAESKTCIGIGSMRTADLENFIFAEMRKKLSEFQTLTANNSKATNPKLTELYAKMARVDTEIEKLVDTLSGANDILLSYANTKVLHLDGERKALQAEIAELSAESVSPEQLERISNYLADWQNVDFNDKRQVLNGLISRISVTNENVEIEWKI